MARAWHPAKHDKHRWAQVRRAIFDRDGWRCCECGGRGALECDHIEPLQREPGQDAWAFDGLQTLCRACHIEKTRRENERPDPERDEWREFLRRLAT